MKKFLKKHQWHLVVLGILFSIAGVSGYYSFRTQDTQNTTQNTDNIVQIENKKEITNYQLPITNTATTFTTSGNNTTFSTLTTKNPVIPYPDPEFQNPIILKVDDEEYQVELKENMTVYGLMQALTLSSIKPFIFTAKEYSGMGYFVDSIGDIKNNDNNSGKYWIYYINGEPAKIGISNYILKPNDLIEWKYETTNM